MNAMELKNKLEKLHIEVLERYNSNNDNNQNYRLGYLNALEYVMTLLILKGVK